MSKTVQCPLLRKPLGKHAERRAALHAGFAVKYFWLIGADRASVGVAWSNLGKEKFEVKKSD